jgi:hypothetical protein
MKELNTLVIWTWLHIKEFSKEPLNGTKFKNWLELGPETLLQLPLIILTYRTKLRDMKDNGAILIDMDKENSITTVEPYMRGISWITWEPEKEHTLSKMEICTKEIGPIMISMDKVTSLLLTEMNTMASS